MARPNFPSEPSYVHTPHGEPTQAGNPLAPQANSGYSHSSNTHSFEASSESGEYYNTGGVGRRDTFTSEGSGQGLVEDGYRE